MPVRYPIVAGVFYPSDAASCRQAAERHLAHAKGCAGPATHWQGTVFGGLVPHAGWTYSGDTAARVYAALCDQRIETVVLFGAVHSRSVSQPSVYGTGSWLTPLGDLEIDKELASLVVSESAGEIVDRPAAHDEEHSLEVQMPFVRYALPQACILPIAVPPSTSASAVGRLVARCARTASRSVVAIGSSDLTHYGPRYGLAPVGAGERALEWTKANDRRLLDLVAAMRMDEVVDEAESHHNACGAGAVSAALGCAAELGADRGVLLEHVTSYEVRPVGPPSDMVGYGAVLFVS